MKIVLVYPNQTELDELLDKYRYTPGYRPDPMIPLGMLYLCSNLDEKHEVEFIDNNIEKLSNQNLFNKILSFNPDIVGFGGTMMEWVQARKVAALLKEADIPTIYGGPNATVNSEKHINYFDYIIRCEGEITLNELLNSLENKENLSNIQGLWFNSGSDVIKNPDRPFINNLDSLKYPSRDIVDINRYCRDSSFPTAYPSDIVVSSRGCPYSCSFCSSKYFWKQSHRTRDIDNTISEIVFLIERYKTKTIHFREDNFTVDKERVIRFCKKLSKLNIEWVCQSRANIIDENTARLMKDSGCKGISFGFESANDKTLKYLKKGITVANSLNAIDICEKVGLNWSGGFMVGVLNENQNDINNTLDFIEKIRKYPHSYLPSEAARFLGFPVSETYYEIIEHKLVEYDWENGELLIPNTYHVTAKNVEKLIRKRELINMTLTGKIKEMLKSVLYAVTPYFVFNKLRNFYRYFRYSQSM